MHIVCFVSFFSIISTAYYLLSGCKVAIKLIDWLILRVRWSIHTSHSKLFTTLTVDCYPTPLMSLSLRHGLGLHRLPNTLGASIVNSINVNTLHRSSTRLPVYDGSAAQQVPPSHFSRCCPTHLTTDGPSWCCWSYSPSTCQKDLLV